MKNNYVELKTEAEFATVKLANGKQLRIHQSTSGRITLRSLTGYFVLFPQGGVNTIDIDIVDFGYRWEKQL